MTYTEKSLTCSDCGKSFPFTADEQEFFATKGFTNEPKRCPACRSSRRSERFGNSGGSYSNRGPGRCILPPAPNVASRPKSPFNLAAINRYTAGTATPNPDKTR